MPELSDCAWPSSQLGEAMESLARRAGLKTHSRSSAQPLQYVDSENDAHELDLRLDRAATVLGIEVEAVETTGSEFQTLLRTAGPAVLRYRTGDKTRFLLLLKASGRKADLLGRDLRIHRCALSTLSRAVLSGLESTVRADVETLLRHAKIPPKRWSRVLPAMLAQRLESRSLDGCWILRAPPSSHFATQLSQTGLIGHLLGIVAAFTCVYGLEASGWALIGRGALEGRLDPGWLVAWLLILFSMLPFRLWGRWLQGLFSIRFGSLLKRRLLYGALQMDTDAIRELGAGRLLGQVIESSVFDSLALNGGFSVVVATIELCFAAWILSLGANGVWPVAALVAWALISIAFILRYYDRLGRWTHTRLELTHALVENMVGHRTRLAQESAKDRHHDEDRLLEHYVEVSRAVDRAFAPLAAAQPRGWMILGLLTLAPELIAGNPESFSLAIGLGGVLLAYRAFAGIATGLSSLARAFVAWKQIAPLFSAGTQVAAIHDPCAVDGNTDPETRASPHALLQARNLVYRYSPLGEPVIEHCDLTIYRGDRLLLEGSSGGGKSTLAALLVGLRRPESGLLLMNGLDPITLGDLWRKQSTAAPQFHENHIFSGTLAFNLLMGRGWPAAREELAEAEKLCRELGLGELLEAMPSGILQTVGETGWQLSHGERSRLYLARALLQKTSMVVLDESFAALDPETLDRCLRCAIARADTLLVIAHP